MISRWHLNRQGVTDDAKVEVDTEMDEHCLSVSSCCQIIQVPLQRREVRLLGPKAEGPPSDYRNVQLHAVELARSENTCRNNNQCQQCLNIRDLDLGGGIRSDTTQCVIYIPVATTLGPQHSPPISETFFVLGDLTMIQLDLGGH